MHSQVDDDDTNNRNNGIGVNWRRGKYSLQRIQDNTGIGSRLSNFVYCLQYDDAQIVCGCRDNTIKFWDRSTLECTKVLQGHRGSVLCLQYDDKVLITGSSDSTVSQGLH